MVPSATRRLKKPCSLQALFSFFNWIEIVCSGCFRTIIPCKKKCMSEARMRRSGRGTDSSLAKLDLVKGNAILEPEAEQQSELFVWEFPSHGGEDGDMFEGRFYVGSEVQTEVEMRSPVEESKGVATIVKAPRSPTILGLSQPSSSMHHPAATDCVVPQSGSKIDILRSSPSSKQAKNLRHHQAATEILAAPSSMAQSASEIDIASSSPSCKNAKNRRSSKPVDILSSSPSPQTLLPESGDGRRNYNLQEHPSSMIADKNAEISPTKGSKPRRSLTDNDFAELRGCIDLGFVFTQDDIPDLRETLPALEVCYAISQNLHDSQASMSPCDDSGSPSPESPSGSPTISSWKVASPGDQPQQVKARLRQWAQAVACNVRQSC